MLCDSNTLIDFEVIHGIATGIPIDSEAVFGGETFILGPMGFDLVFVDGLIQSVVKRRVYFAAIVEDGPKFMIKGHIAGVGLGRRSRS